MQCLTWAVITAVAVFLVAVGWFVWGFLSGKPDITEEDMFESLWKEEGNRDESTY